MLKTISRKTIAMLSLATLFSTGFTHYAYADTKVSHKATTKTLAKENNVFQAKADADGYIDIKNDTERYERLSKIVKEKFNVLPDRISEVPEIGMYEVLMPDSHILYFSKNEKYLIDGVLVKLDNMKVNITQERSTKSLPYDEKLLDFKDAIKTVSGDGSRRLVTFEDPNCGYCKRFAQEKQKLNNVTIYTFIIPILGPDSLDKAKKIWCSTDRAKAWEADMANVPLSGSADCDTSVLNRNLEVAKKLRVTGTPTLFFEDGKRLIGSTPIETIEKKFSEIKK